MMTRRGRDRRDREIDKEREGERGDEDRREEGRDRSDREIDGTEGGEKRQGERER